MFNEQSSISFFTVDAEFEQHIRVKLEAFATDPSPDQVRENERQGD